MKKYLLMLLLVLSAFIVISCNMEDADSDTANSTVGVKYTQVMFQPMYSQTKRISQTNSTTPTSYRYKAEPLFEKNDSQIEYGDTNGFEDLTKNADSDYYSSTNKFVQGRWLFTIEALVDDSVLYSGSVNVVLNTQTQVVAIDLLLCFDSQKSGTVNLNVRAPVLSENHTGIFTANLFTAEYQALTSPSGIAVTPDYSSQSVVVGTGSAVLPEGMYILELSYNDSGAGVGPCLTAFIVKESMTCTISGSIDNSEYVTPSLCLSYLRGSITRSMTKTDGKYVYTFIPEGGVAPTSCIWFVNGTRQASSTTQMQWDTDTGGIYYITCIALRKVGSEVVDVFSTTKTETR